MAGSGLMADESYENRKAEWARVPADAELAGMIEKAQRPGIFLDKVTSDDPAAALGCWLGGQPTLPASVPWPHVWLHDEPFDADFPEGPEPYPMHFVGQINLAEIPVGSVADGLPQSGTLFFFADAYQNPSNAPRTRADDSAYSGTSSVIYVADDVSDEPARKMPEVSVDPDELSDPSGVFGIPDGEYALWKIAIRPFKGLVKDTFANATFFSEVNNRSIAAQDAAREQFEARSALLGPSGPRVFAEHHFCGSNSRDEVGGNNYRLLALQNDRDLGFKCNAGWIVFWINVDELQRGNFSAAFAASEAL